MRALEEMGEGSRDHQGLAFLRLGFLRKEGVRPASVDH